MGNKFDEMRAAVYEAEIQLRAVDRMTCDLARLIKGRLRQANSWDLADLKRELRSFNMVTGRWKDD